MDDVGEFAVKKLREYAKEKHTIVRSTSDLSPLEEWLLVELHKTDSIWKRAMRQVSKWRVNK